MRLREARDRWLRGDLRRETVGLGVVRLKISRHREKDGTKSRFKGLPLTTPIWSKSFRRIHGLRNSKKMKKKEKCGVSLPATGQWVRTTKSTLVYLMRTLMAVSINTFPLKSRITNAPLLAFSMILLWQICKEQMLGASKGLTSAKSFLSYFMMNRAPTWLLHINWFGRTNSSSPSALVKWLFIHSLMTT